VQTFFSEHKSEQHVEVEGVSPDSIQRLYGLMTSLAHALPAIHEMGLTNKDGDAIVKSLVPSPVGMNYRERDYFRYLQSHDTRDVFIGQPVEAKSTARSTLRSRAGSTIGTATSAASW